VAGGRPRLPAIAGAPGDTPATNNPALDRAGYSSVMIFSDSFRLFLLLQKFIANSIHVYYFHNEI
jgi:hypothetical protein